MSDAEASQAPRPDVPGSSGEARTGSSAPRDPVERVRRALAAAGITAPIRFLDSSARTAALAAEQLGVEVGAIANSLVFQADGDPLVVMASGAHRVDTALLADTLGVRRIDRADAAFVRRHTGQTIGGVAPVGHPTPLRTVVDTALKPYPRLWAAGGHPHAVFPTTYRELIRMTGGTPVAVAADGPAPT